MNMIWKMLMIVVAGYLLGNFQTGVLVSRSIGKFDIRHRGSSNAGTTNVLRTMGWVPSLLTLLGDVVKAALAALLGRLLMGDWGARIGGLSAILGHNWPVLFGFKGGKGIAASLGMILVTDPWIALALVVCQTVVLVISHTMSLASLASAGLYAVLSVIVHWGDWPRMTFAVGVMLLAVWSHRENIDRLARNRENKLDFEEIDRISKHQQ